LRSVRLVGSPWAISAARRQLVGPLDLDLHVQAAWSGACSAIGPLVGIEAAGQLGDGIVGGVDVALQAAQRAVAARRCSPGTRRRTAQGRASPRRGREPTRRRHLRTAAPNRGSRGGARDGEDQGTGEVASRQRPRDDPPSEAQEDEDSDARFGHGRTSRWRITVRSRLHRCARRRHPRDVSSPWLLPRPSSTPTRLAPQPPEPREGSIALPR